MKIDLREYRPDKFKKDDKKQTVSTAPKNKEEELQREVRLLKKVLNDPAKYGFKIPFDDSDIKATAFSAADLDDINKSKDITKIQLTKLAIDAEKVARFFHRLATEQVNDEIEAKMTDTGLVDVQPTKANLLYDNYETNTNPFTQRIKPFEPICKKIQNALAALLHNLSQRFKDEYEQFLSVAENCDKGRSHNLRESIRKFQDAAYYLYETAQTIHLETMKKISQEKPEDTGTNASKARDTIKKHKPVLSDFKDVEQAVIKGLGKDKLKYQPIIKNSGYYDGGYIKSAIQNLKIAKIVKHERPFYSLYPQYYYLLKSKK